MNTSIKIQIILTLISLFFSFLNFWIVKFGNGRKYLPYYRFILYIILCEILYLLFYLLQAIAAHFYSIHEKQDNKIQFDEKFNFENNNSILINSSNSSSIYPSTYSFTELSNISPYTSTNSYEIFCTLSGSLLIFFHNFLIFLVLFTLILSYILLQHLNNSPYDLVLTYNFFLKKNLLGTKNWWNIMKINQNTLKKKQKIIEIEDYEEKKEKTIEEIKNIDLNICKNKIKGKKITMSIYNKIYYITCWVFNSIIIITFLLIGSFGFSPYNQGKISYI